ncbi:acyltransferase [Erythrobacter sp. R86502]|uniref:acyltransferase n=1 Tax=Erythrobacter sp. R86502 TaxID=3093846 RepID=UPI0036D262C9
MGLRSAWNAISAVFKGTGSPATDWNRAADGQQSGQSEPTAASLDPGAVGALPSAANVPSTSPALPQPGLVGLEGDLAGNHIEIGDNITLVGTIKGQGNVIRIGASQNPQTLNLYVFGHDNEILIGSGSLLQNLRIEIGSVRWMCSRARIRIGDGFSIASQGRFILPNSGNLLEIGDRCMFSSNIVVRGGEYPHLVFDNESGAYLDVSDGIFIGNHVWVGEGVFIGKSVTLPDDCIVGTRSVVTKRFDETHCVIAGNPARIVKRSVRWVANEFMLEEQFPAGHAAFSDTQINKVNRAERERAKAKAVSEAQSPAVTVETD